MFESTITPAVAALDAPHALRPLKWDEIVARLSAARDLREILRRPALPAGSFAGRTGYAFAAARDGERAVNHDALGRGKMPAAISVATHTEAAASDQGTR